MIDPANLERYILWVATNGDNRQLTWGEICQMEPDEQHDFAILSRIYGKATTRWRKQKETEDHQRKEIEKTQRKGKR